MKYFIWSLVFLSLAIGLFVDEAEPVAVAIFVSALFFLLRKAYKNKVLYELILNFPVIILAMVSVCLSFDTVFKGAVEHRGLLFLFLFLINYSFFSLLLSVVVGFFRWVVKNVSK